MLLALDDTDSPRGGCTTHVAAYLAHRLGRQALAGRPRLVRLNPSNPYKTRGNAALALPLDASLEPDEVLKEAIPLVEEHSRVTEAKGAGLLLLEDPPNPAWYERGLTEQIPLENAREAVEDARTFTLGNGRGLVGALCAAAWDPRVRNHTFTRIAYRDPERYGTPRDLDQQAVHQLEQREGTFDCWDPHDETPTIAPRTPCPVLHGIRATSPHPLDASTLPLTEEDEALATTFVTNQATDDHIQPSRIEPVRISGTPRPLEGGHVHAKGTTPQGRALDLLAYEPTGTLREPVRDLREGDHVVPIGGGPQGQVNLEKALLVPQEREQTTACPGCGGRMASTGEDAPRRCPRCGALESPEREAPGAFWVEADPSARRHLARPLQLGLAPHVREGVQDALRRAGLAQARGQLS